MEQIARSLLQLWWLASPPAGRDERGDVPGWVMVTVMTAGVVAVLTGILRPELSGMLRNALNSVK